MPPPPFDFSENAARLRNCRGPHTFVEMPGQDNILRDLRVYRCQNCSGTLCGHFVAWYARGMEHGVLLGKRA